jgi:hypothetical protein
MGQRLAGTPHADRTVLLQVETDLGHNTIGLNPDAGQQTVVSLKAPQQTLLQVIVGYLPVSLLRRMDGVELSEGAEPVLEALFGGQSPYVWQADRF